MTSFVAILTIFTWTGACYDRRWWWPIWLDHYCSYEQCFHTWTQIKVCIYNYAVISWPWDQEHTSTCIGDTHWLQQWTGRTSPLILVVVEGTNCQGEFPENLWKIWFSKKSCFCSFLPKIRSILKGKYNELFDAIDVSVYACSCMSMHVHIHAWYIIIHYHYCHRDTTAGGRCRLRMLTVHLYITCTRWGRHPRDVCLPLRRSSTPTVYRLRSIDETALKVMQWAIS